MKKTTFSLAAVLALSGPSAALDKGLEELAAAASNIVVGQVYYVSEYSFGVSADWEIKGQLGLAGCDVPFLDGRRGVKLKSGDKVIVFIHRSDTRILPGRAAPLGLKVSRPDEFLGQCAYRVVNDTAGHAMVSRVYDAAGDKLLASAFSF